MLRGNFVYGSLCVTEVPDPSNVSLQNLLAVLDIEAAGWGFVYTLT